MSIISKNQSSFLTLFSNNPDLTGKYYLTGGTALAEYYIPYRLSEDLDFFSETEIDLQMITIFLKSVQKKLKYRKIDINSSFNRNIIHLLFENETLKLEFTYFPFPQIEKPQNKAGVLIDSVTDIAVNKLFTIYQKPRSRDFMDLYMIQKKYGFEMIYLIKKAKVKFDWHVDPIKLGSQFLLADEVKDYPKLLKPLSEKLWKSYFKNEAKKFDRKIFK